LNSENEKTEEESQLEADWLDIGGSVLGLTPEELEALAVSDFGCPEV